MWVKLDDKLPRNPKILAGDIETAWLYTCALTHAAEQLTDGYLAASVLPVLAPHIDDPRSVAARCADLGLFRQVEGGYLIPDFLEFNPSREQTITKRAKDRDRQASHRGSRGDDDDEEGDPDPEPMSREVSQRESQRDTAATSDVTPRVPSRPVPTSPVVTQSSLRAYNAPADDDESSTGTPQPPDTDRFDAVLDAIATAQAHGQHIRKPDAWRRRVITNARTEHGDTITAALNRWPTAPPEMLAAHVLGQPAPYLETHRSPT